MDLHRWSMIRGLLVVTSLGVGACDQGPEDSFDRIERQEHERGELVIDANVSPEHQDAVRELAYDALASLPDGPLDADAAPDCSADHVETVTTTNTVCDGDIMCACFDAAGQFSVHGPLQLGETCTVPPGGVCSTVPSPAGQACAVAEASTPDPVCPAQCTPMGKVDVSSTAGPPNCCTAIKSLDCCCPDVDVEDIMEE